MLIASLTAIFSRRRRSGPSSPFSSPIETTQFLFPIGARHGRPQAPTSIPYRTTPVSNSGKSNLTNSGQVTTRWNPVAAHSLSLTCPQSENARHVFGPKAGRQARTTRQDDKAGRQGRTTRQDDKAGRQGRTTRQDDRRDHGNEGFSTPTWCGRLLRLSFARLEHCFEFFFKRSRRNSECAKSRPVL